MPSAMPHASSNDDIGAVELPDGRLVCRSHGWAVCPYCCLDFSFMEELSESDDPEEEFLSETGELYQELATESRAAIDARWGPPPSRANAQASLQTSDRRSPGSDNTASIIIPTLPRPDRSEARLGMERVFPTKFNCPSTTSTPSELFPARISHDAIPPVIRYTRRNNPKQMLIYTDGACLNNGQANPRAGWAFVFKPDSDPQRGIVSARLEGKGPYGDESSQTSNRAELRAVLSAIRFRAWTGEGFTTLVFATDSEYVAQGATTWVRIWVRNGWRTSTGAEVKNKDLWEKLLEEVQRWDAEGFKIQFWRIPRMLNATADYAANQAAEDEDLDGYCDIKGVLV